MMIYIKVCFLCFFLFQTTSLDAFQKDKTKLKHTIEVSHPGKENGGLQKQVLIEVKNNEGKTTAYYADVESVICKETVCKIISVRLFWNEFGAYKKFIIKKGTQLEKWEGLPFTFLDYQKLQDILSNKNSPFKELKIYEVVNTLATSSDGSSSYDGISGATSISLNEYETIFGATLTCYTLWHWVYGSIRTNIRDITGNNLKSSDFIKLLKSKNKEDRNFALEQLTFHLIYEDQISKTILHQYKNDKLSLKSMLNYFEKSTVNIYFSTLKKLFLNANIKDKTALINSLLNSKLIPEDDFYHQFSSLLPTLNSSQELVLFLKLMKAKKVESSKIVTHTAKMLKKDFFVAREFYFYAKNEQLSIHQKEQLDSFYNKYKDQL